MGKPGAADQKRKESAKAVTEGSASDKGSLPASKKLKARGQARKGADGAAKSRPPRKEDSAQAEGEVEEGGEEMEVTIPEAQKRSENGKSFSIRSLRKRENETAGLYREAKTKRVSKQETVEVKAENEAESEEIALVMTLPPQGRDKEPPQRQLLDACFHDDQGTYVWLEQLHSVEELLLTGAVLPHDAPPNRAQGWVCHGFGPVIDWRIDGFEKGTRAAAIVVCTEAAEYLCVRACQKQRKEFLELQAKCELAVEVFRALSKPDGGNPDLSLSELQATVSRALSGPRAISLGNGMSVKDALIAEHQFVLERLKELDASASGNDQVFANLPSLTALAALGAKYSAMRNRFTSGAQQASAGTKSGGGRSSGSALKICDSKAGASGSGSGSEAALRSGSASGSGSGSGSGMASGSGSGSGSGSASAANGMDRDSALSDDEGLANMVASHLAKQQHGRRPKQPEKGYLKIDERELADDYPAPKHYKLAEEEMDELLLFDDLGGEVHPDDLPRRKLENWVLYDDQLKFTSLELLPMQSDVESDVLVFGSGTMLEDDGEGYVIGEAHPSATGAHSSAIGAAGGSGSGASSSGASGSGASGSRQQETRGQAGGSSASGIAPAGVHAGGSSSKGAEEPAPEGESEPAGGVRIFLSAIREWELELGAGVLFVSIRTDCCWYRLGKPAAGYTPWYRPVIRAATLATQAITMLENESRASRLSFKDVVHRLAEQRFAELQLKIQRAGGEKKAVKTSVARLEAATERFLLVHGQIFLQCFRMFPKSTISRSAFVTGLKLTMASRRHTLLKVVKKKGGLGGRARVSSNANPAASLRPDATKRKPMRATTTRLIDSIWKSYFEKHALEKGDAGAAKGKAGGKGKKGGGEAETGEGVGAVEDEKGEEEEEEEKEEEEEEEEEELKDEDSDVEEVIEEEQGAAKARRLARKEMKKKSGARAGAKTPDSAKKAGKAGIEGASVEKGNKGGAQKAAKWVGKPVGELEDGEMVYPKATVHGFDVVPGQCYAVNPEDGAGEAAGGGGGEGQTPVIVLVEFLWEDEEGAKLAHGRVLEMASASILGNAGDEFEVFLTQECLDVYLRNVREPVTVTRWDRPWGPKERRANLEWILSEASRLQTVAASGKKEYFLRSLYVPHKGAFLELPPKAQIGAGTGVCVACRETAEEEAQSAFLPLDGLDRGKGFRHEGHEYREGDFVFVDPTVVRGAEAGAGVTARETFKGGRNKGLKAWAVAQIVGFKYGAVASKGRNGGAKAPGSSEGVPTSISVRLFVRPEELTSDDNPLAYRAHVQELYYSEETATVGVQDVVGKCMVLRQAPPPPDPSQDHLGSRVAAGVPGPGGKSGKPLMAFFCDRIVTKEGGTRSLPADIRLGTAGASHPASTSASVAAVSKGKGKGKAEAKDEPEDEARAASKGKGKLEETPEAPKAVVDKGKGKAVETGDTESPTDSKPSAHPGDASALPHSQKLATLDIFAGCGGLSEGLQQSGCTETKWAIEYEHPAAEAFKLNHPHAHVFCHNCNVILRRMMEDNGEAEDCVSTAEAEAAAREMQDSEAQQLPRPGQVDFVNGGPPCQGFSGMNRFNMNPWSKVQCEMILAFLSFADYLRPRFFLLENVRNFVVFNGAQTFRLSLASLLAMGYQVRFGVLQAGNFGVSQSRKRAFIWGAAPGEVLPDWPQPLHVFASSQMGVPLPGGSHFLSARTAGAPLRSITVRDTIADLPPVENGEEELEQQYVEGPQSWFQKLVRGRESVLSDHICKRMNELNLIRCRHIPKRPGADWRDLAPIKVTLSDKTEADLIPWCLPNTSARHNEWKGLFGRLDWDGNFPTSVTDPQPMGKVGMCFHPDQDRIVTVRECARSQGFPDRFRFYGTIQAKHRQIGNAVPPPLACAIGQKLKEALAQKEANNNM